MQTISTSFKKIELLFYKIYNAHHPTTMEPNRIDTNDLWAETLRLEQQALSEAAEQKYKDALKEGGAADICETAMKWIMIMNGKEFQDRLFNGTMPKFVCAPVEELTEEERIWRPIPRLTSHPYMRLSDEALLAGIASQGYINREQLRYCSVEHFIENYYYEFEEDCY